MKRFSEGWRRAAFAAVLAVVATIAASCSGSPPVRLYVLVPLPASGETGPAADRDPSGLAVGVGPIALAPHLDRPQMVTRSGNELQLGELDRWGEPLRDGIARTVAENLADLLASDRVWVHPWRPALPVELQVVVEVLRCDFESGGEPGGETVFIARWTVLGADGEMRAVRRSSFREAAAGPESVAGALSRSLAAFSRELAGVLEELAQRPAGSS